MFKNILKGSIIYIIILVFVVPIIILVLFANTARKQGGNSITVTPSIAPAQQNVPFPSKQDAIRTFCALIDEGRISDAVSMMDITDDTIRQSWGVYLNNFSSFKLMNIEDNVIDETGNSFEVDIKITLKENLTNLPIPNYGWVNGMNKKWIGVVESSPKNYKIREIATGP